MFKRNHIFMFIIVLFVMFMGTNEVMARNEQGAGGVGESTGKYKELTCVYYYKGKNRGSIYNGYVIIQDKNGKLVTYYRDAQVGKFSDDEYNYFENKDSKKFNEYWNVLSAIENYNFDETTKVESDKKALTSCPASIENYGHEGKMIEFFDSDKKLPLLKEYTFNLLGVSSSTVNPDYTDDGESVGKGKKCSELDLEKYWLVDADKSYWNRICLYALDYGNDCHIFQFNYNDSAWEGYSSYATYPDYNVSISSDFNQDSGDLKAFTKICPPSVYGALNTASDAASGNLIFNFDLETHVNYQKYVLFHSNFDGVENFGIEYEDLVNHEVIEIKSCEDLLSDEMIEILSSAISLVKILVPLSLIGLGIADFAKAVFAAKEDDMKKTTSTFIKRLIIAILIFFVPSLLELLLTIASKIWPFIDPTLCNIL